MKSAFDLGKLGHFLYFDAVQLSRGLSQWGSDSTSFIKHLKSVIVAPGNLQRVYFCRRL